MVEYRVSQLTLEEKTIISIKFIAYKLYRGNNLSFASKLITIYFEPPIVEQAGFAMVTLTMGK